MLQSVVITRKVSKGEKAAVIGKSSFFVWNKKSKSNFFFCLFRSPQRKVFPSYFVVSESRSCEKEIHYVKFFLFPKECWIWSFSKNGGSVALSAGQGAGGQGSWLAVLVLPPTHCVTPGKSLILPVPQLIIRQKTWGRDPGLVVVLWMP